MMPSPAYGDNARCRKTGIDPDDAAAASVELYEAMRRQFLRFADFHGVTVRDAMLLCMNGEAL